MKKNFNLKKIEEKLWTGYVKFDELPPVVQFQIIDHSLNNIAKYIIREFGKNVDNDIIFAIAQGYVNRNKDIYGDVIKDITIPKLIADKIKFNN